MNEISPVNVHAKTQPIGHTSQNPKIAAFMNLLVEYCEKNDTYNEKALTDKISTFFKDLNTDEQKQAKKAIIETANKSISNQDIKVSIQKICNDWRPESKHFPTSQLSHSSSTSSSIFSSWWSSSSKSGSLSSSSARNSPKIDEENDPLISTKLTRAEMRKLIVTNKFCLAFEEFNTTYFPPLIDGNIASFAYGDYTKSDFKNITDICNINNKAKKNILFLHKLLNYVTNPNVRGETLSGANMKVEISSTNLEGGFFIKLKPEKGTTALKFFIYDNTITGELHHQGYSGGWSQSLSITGKLDRLKAALTAQVNNIKMYGHISHENHDFKASFDMFKTKDSIFGKASNAKICSVLFKGRQGDARDNWTDDDKNGIGFIGSLAQQKNQYPDKYTVYSIDGVRRGNYPAKILKQNMFTSFAADIAASTILSNVFSEIPINNQMIEGLSNLLDYIISCIKNNNKEINIEIVGTDFGALAAVSMYSYLQLLFKIDEYNYKENTLGTSELRSDKEKEGYLQIEFGLYDLEDMKNKKIKEKVDFMKLITTKFKNKLNDIKQSGGVNDITFNYHITISHLFVGGELTPECQSKHLATPYGKNSKVFLEMLIAGKRTTETDNALANAVLAIQRTVTNSYSYDLSHITVDPSAITDDEPQIGTQTFVLNLKWDEMKKCNAIAIENDKNEIVKWVEVGRDKVSISADDTVKIRIHKLSSQKVIEVNKKLADKAERDKAEQAEEAKEAELRKQEEAKQAKLRKQEEIEQKQINQSEALRWIQNSVLKYIKSGNIVIDENDANSIHDEISNGIFDENLNKTLMTFDTGFGLQLDYVKEVTDQFSNSLEFDSYKGLLKWVNNQSEQLLANQSKNPSTDNTNHMKLVKAVISLFLASNSGHFVVGKQLLVEILKLYMANPENELFRHTFLSSIGDPAPSYREMGTDTKFTTIIQNHLYDSIRALDQTSSQDASQNFISSEIKFQLIHLISYVLKNKQVTSDDFNSTLKHVFNELFAIYLKFNNPVLLGVLQNITMPMVNRGVKCDSQLGALDNNSKTVFTKFMETMYDNSGVNEKLNNFLDQTLLFVSKSQAPQEFFWDKIREIDLGSLFKELRNQIKLSNREDTHKGEFMADYLRANSLYLVLDGNSYQMNAEVVNCEMKLAEKFSDKINNINMKQIIPLLFAQKYRNDVLSSLNRLLQTSANPFMVKGGDYLYRNEFIPVNSSEKAEPSDVLCVKSRVIHQSQEKQMVLEYSLFFDNTKIEGDFYDSEVEILQNIQLNSITLKDGDYLVTACATENGNIQLTSGQGNIIAESGTIKFGHKPQSSTSSSSEKASSVNYSFV